MGMRGMTQIGYPAYHGLPEWDPVYEILEDKADIPAMFPDVEWHDLNDTVIWCARKEWIRGKKLTEYLPNDKTKAVIKLAKTGSGAPVSEPQIDKETHQKMLAYYHKKQEEHKALEQDEDSYMSQPWANPNQLKNQLINGNKGVNWRPA